MQLGNTRAEVMLIEIIPSSWLKNSVFILNIYSSPRDRHQAFLSIIAKAAAKARDAPLVVAGDFNAAHQAWGYVRHSPKGINLLQAVTNCSLELVTDHSFPRASVIQSRGTPRRIWPSLRMPPLLVGTISKKTWEVTILLWRFLWKLPQPP